MSASQRDQLVIEYREVPTEDVIRNPANPREVFPQDELNRLADSIDQEGVLVPVSVFPKDGKFVLVDGERRWRCVTELGLPTIPAVVMPEASEHDVLVRMFNIHLIREPWRDIPTAHALQRLVEQLEAAGEEITDTKLHELTGLSIPRIQRLRYVVQLPDEWQGYVADGSVPLNYFWEVKRAVDALRNHRPELADELGEDAVTQAFVTKRLDGVVTDTISLRDVGVMLRYAGEDAAQSESGTSVIDDTIRDLVRHPELTIQEAYEDTVQVMVEVDKLERRTGAIVANFERLLARARSEEERDQIKRIGNAFIGRLTEVLQ